MTKKKLGVNIDHIATLRNARGETYPSPLRAALLGQKHGIDSITIHLREDRRHIRDIDLKNIKKNLNIPLNLEIAPTKEMLKIALKYKPDYVCIVPEKREELTTEGGLNLSKKNIFLKKMINELKKKHIRVSLFIEPKISDIKISKNLNAECVELHTGKYCRLSNMNKDANKEFVKIKKAAIFANKIKLQVHAGHGLTYKTAHKLAKIKNISEFNIGHFIISESVFLGIKKTINNFKRILR